MAIDNQLKVETKKEAIKALLEEMVADSAGAMGATIA
jgi:hypothetical protein